MDQSEKVSRKLEFTLQEYVAVRQENTTAIQSMQGTLQFGIAAISVILLGVVQSWGQDLVISSLLLLGIGPAICLVVERVWLGEVTRLARASYFMWQLEVEVNRFLAEGTPGITGTRTASPLMENALHWEIWVRGLNPWGKTLKTTRNYQAILNFLLGLGTLFIAMGVGRISTSDGTNLWLKVFGCVLGGLLTILLVVERIAAGRRIAFYSIDPT